MKDNLDGKIGALFPPTSRFVGKIAFATGLISILVAPIAGFFFLLVGAYVGFGESGIKLKPSEKSYQDYSRVFGLRFGKSMSYDNYPFLSVMRTKVTSSVFSITNRKAETGSDLYFDVYFLSASHRDKVLIRRYSKLNDAEQSAKELSEILKKDVVMYSPHVSQASKSRR